MMIFCNHVSACVMLAYWSVQLLFVCVNFWSLQVYEQESSMSCLPAVLIIVHDLPLQNKHDITSIIDHRP